MISRNLKLLIVLIITVTAGLYIILVTIPTQLTKRSYNAARTLGEEFRKVFQFTPEVTVNNTIVLNQQTPIFELSVLSQTFEHRYAWQNEWLGSRKKISINGRFVAKIGFDLRERFAVTLQDNKAIITLGEPRVLSLESQGDIVYRDEHGIWNWVNVDDRTKATNAFISDARRYAEQAGFVQEAKIKMEEQLIKVLQPYAERMVIHYKSPASVTK